MGGVQCALGGNIEDVVWKHRSLGSPVVDVGVSSDLTFSSSFWGELKNFSLMPRMMNFREPDTLIRRHNSHDRAEGGEKQYTRES